MVPLPYYCKDEANGVSLCCAVGEMECIVTEVSVVSVGPGLQSCKTPVSPFLSCFFSHPGYFGKVGMRHFHLTKQKYWCPTINLDRLWSLVSEQTRQAYKDREDKAPVIDVTQAVSCSYCFTGLSHHNAAHICQEMGF